MAHSEISVGIDVVLVMLKETQAKSPISSHFIQIEKGLFSAAEFKAAEKIATPGRAADKISNPGVFNFFDDREKVRLANMPNFFKLLADGAFSYASFGTHTQRECPRPRRSGLQGLPDAPAALSAGCGRFPAARARRRGTTFSLPLPPRTPRQTLTVVCPARFMLCLTPPPLSLSPHASPSPEQFPRARAHTPPATPPCRPTWQRCSAERQSTQATGPRKKRNLIFKNFQIQVATSLQTPGSPGGHPAAYRAAPPRAPTRRNPLPGPLRSWKRGSHRSETRRWPAPASLQN